MSSAINSPDMVNMSAEKYFDVNCVEFDKLVIVSMYRSPTGNLDIFKEKLEQCLTKNPIITTRASFCVEILT